VGIAKPFESGKNQKLRENEICNLQAATEHTNFKGIGSLNFSYWIQSVYNTPLVQKQFSSAAPFGECF